jgi:uncharacterized membrane protein
MNTTAERLVDDYLARLDAALAGVPADRRREIVEEIEAHLAAAVEAAPGDEIALREAIDRLGEPEEIAAEAQERAAPAAPAPARRGGLETATIVLLLVGGFIGGFGWLVGVALLWMSDVWRVRDKLIGTLVLPGGLAFSAVLLVSVGTSAGSGACYGSPGEATVCTNTGGTPGWEQALLTAALVLCVVLPIATAVYLARRSRPTTQPS